VKKMRQIISIVVFGILFAHGAAARTVVDHLGRTVSVPDNPRRVVSLAPSITEIVFALEQGHRLKGATVYSDYPQAAKRLPRVGSYVYLDLEKIVALKPDLCIAVKDGNPVAVVRRLAQFNIPVYAVDPRNLESVMETVQRLGDLLGASDKADLLVGDMQARVERVKTRVKSAAHVPRVFLQIGISPIVSVGANTHIHELIILAGGENVAAGPVPYPRFSKEQVIGLAPEVFIITSMARGEVFARVRAEWQRWSDVPALKNDRIVLVDSDILDRATPRLVDGLELLLTLIHPEIVLPAQGRGDS
jgi:iron complex transport system substrate-binding protein